MVCFSIQGELVGQWGRFRYVRYIPAYPNVKLNEITRVLRSGAQEQVDFISNFVLYPFGDGLKYLDSQVSMGNVEQSTVSDLRSLEFWSSSGRIHPLISGEYVAVFVGINTYRDTWHAVIKGELEHYMNKPVEWTEFPGEGPTRFFVIGRVTLRRVENVDCFGGREVVYH